MGELKEFLAKETSRWDDRAESLEVVKSDLVRLVTMYLERAWSAVQRPGAPIVYSRVKTRDSVSRRIEERYKSLEDFPDLVGIRVVVLHSGEVSLVETALESLVRHGSREVTSYRAQRGRATGYSGMVYSKIPIVSVRDLSRRGDRSPVVSEAIESVAGMCWELQVHTAMQEAWSRLSHAFFYKDAIGIPHASWRQLDRLAAVTDLVDEQLRMIDAGIEEERQRLRAQMMDVEQRPSIRIDEYALVLTQHIWPQRWEGLRALGREAGLRCSEWPELIRVGDETDICMNVALATAIGFMGELEVYIDSLIEEDSWDFNVQRLREAFGMGDMVDSSAGQGGDILVNRPLLVLSVLRLLDFPEKIEQVVGLRPSVRERLLESIA